VSSLRCLGRMLGANLSRISSCGRQFLTWGGPSSSRSRANRAADIDRPRIPSPHSFSALQCRLDHVTTGMTFTVVKGTLGGTERRLKKTW